MNLELRVEQLGDEHIEPYVLLSRSEYGADAAISQPSHLRWKFLENPQGPSIGIHVYDRGELIGRMVAMPREIIHKNTSCRAAFMVDLVVEPKHRGMVPLFLLMEGLKQLSQFDLVLVTPNSAGAVVWEKFAKMPSQFDLGVAAMPFRPATVANKSGKVKMDGLAAPLDWMYQSLIGGMSCLAAPFFRSNVEDRWPPTSELDLLFQKSRNHEFAAGARTAAFMDWRFKRSPIFRYEVWFVRRARELIGYLVTRRARYEGYDCRFVVDIFACPEYARHKWREVRLRVLRTGVAERIEMAMAIGNDLCWPFSDVARLPFWKVHRRFLPRAVTLYGRWINHPRFPFAPKNLYFTLGDCDMV
jgi:hypothetical protein